ncbi:hypothetical protein [uncultured Acetatifactor sp.]|jgi:hypothetical protein|uniref:hypothetical protein n=1 Tax=uncultured Acetatifactor sp. TaxID=1671927 RepID=UPI00262F12D0|nr:hypothetical protein [uncultured Acetatifactor sp.]MCI8697239.1 hypothetical protein [Lachnospiraceae bacterium]
MKGKGLRKRYAEWIQALSALLLIAMAGLTLHDMQTAEGAGLYLAIKAGAEDRRMYDFAVDAAGMLCLLLLLLLPCLLQKRLRPAPFLRFASASLAFLPVVSMALLVHLADGTEEMALRQAISMGQPGAALLEWLGELLPALSAGLPVLILAFGMVRAGSAEELAGRAVSVEELAEKAENPENLAGKAGSPKDLAGKAEGAGSSEKTRPHPWLPRAAGLAALALSAVSLLFPALSDICVYLIVYLLLAAAFSLWEKLHDAHPGLNAWGWILFGGFWLRAVERMLEIMSVYHL